MSPHPRTRTAIHITKRSVEAAKPASTDYFVWDDELRRFGVRMYSTGRRVFVRKYRLQGDLRTPRARLGAYPDLTAEAARKAALLLLVGEAPKDVRTGLSRLIAERGPKLKPRTVAQYERLWRVTLAPTFGKTLVSALFDDAVVEGHVKRAKTPMVAKRGVDLLASVCQWAERKKFRPRYKFQLNRFPTISARLRNSHAGLFALRTGVLPLSGRLVDFRGPVAGHLSSSLTGRYK